MTIDASNRKSIRHKEKQAAIAEAARIAYVRTIMSTLEGREWMHTLLESCFLFAEPFVRSAPDATAHNLGRQSVGKQIFADLINHCSQTYIYMMQEAHAKEVANDRYDSNHRSAADERPGSEDPRGRDQGPDAPDDYGSEAPE